MRHKSERVARREGLMVVATLLSVVEEEPPGIGALL